MLKRFVISLLLGAGAYILVTILSLVMFHPLPLILWRGLRFLLGVFLLTFILQIIFYLIQNSKGGKDRGEIDSTSASRAAEHYQDQDSEGQAGPEASEVSSRESTGESDSEPETSEEEFSPLDPPVMETEEEEF
ncbi:hypothetical protein [Halarsenatibacter silvermanii]|uniref:Uncharacterized protein n=1 Tax=Halarsenatibacter silvermanii TaxID=321763 RepID=A0A1G9MK76_9FIRM|nr:hypothetical protein [Halarsenatibacter silvermanii]SDL74483.1 hypothetical protein SAMN04488692_10890 [Halarsenatibacter silvermanii]